jgi:hypothetical protein
MFKGRETRTYSSSEANFSTIIGRFQSVGELPVLSSFFINVCNVPGCYVAQPRPHSLYYWFLWNIICIKLSRFFIIFIFFKLFSHWQISTVVPWQTGPPISGWFRQFCVPYSPVLPSEIVTVYYYHHYLLVFKMIYWFYKWPCAVKLAC